MTKSAGTIYMAAVIITQLMSKLGQEPRFSGYCYDVISTTVFCYFKICKRTPKRKRGETSRSLTLKSLLPLALRNPALGGMTAPEASSWRHARTASLWPMISLSREKDCDPLSWVSSSAEHPCFAFLPSFLGVWSKTVPWGEISKQPYIAGLFSTEWTDSLSFKGKRRPYFC